VPGNLRYPGALVFEYEDQEAQGMDIEKSYNFRRLTERLTTSGIVHPDGLNELGAQGYQVLINLLPDSSENAVPHEREIVECQGIEYSHIPVDFTQPAVSDFRKFVEILDRNCDKKIHVHCAANYRVSAFCSLYMVRLGIWSAERGMAHIRSIWQPDEYPGWPAFISRILGEIGNGDGKGC